MIGFPVVGCTGFPFTSIVEVWIAGYAEPGFWGAVGFVAAAAAGAVTGVEASRRGVAEGVPDFEMADESAEEGRCGSCRKLAWRGWELQRVS
jgi:hypothetical protein